MRKGKVVEEILAQAKASRSDLTAIGISRPEARSAWCWHWSPRKFFG